MSNKSWKNKWKKNDIGFHQPSTNPLLRRFLPQLKLPANEKILVPLCGKSHDMDLMADDGYHVMGIELSKIAIQAYFDARRVKPSQEKRGRFIVWRERNIEIWCGDIFDLTENELSQIKMLYDCASLTAFPSISRPRYVQHFHEKLSRQSQILLMTTESPDERQFNSVLTIDSEVKALYENNYHIQLLHGQKSLTTDPEYPNDSMSMMEEKVYLIKNH